MFKDRAPKAKRGTVAYARAERRRMSPPEVLLWQVLRREPEGFRFRRGHPTGAYRLDFYCIDAKLAVEVDGQHHALAGRPERDALRDAWLAAHGIETLRIPAREVFADLGAVVTGVVAQCRARLPLHHAAHGPPSPAELGEE